MATVNLYLKGALSKKNFQFLAKTDNQFLQNYLENPLQIICKVNMVGKRLQIYTKKRIAPKYWDSEKQLANCQKYKTGCIEFNNWLFALKQSIETRCVVLENDSRRISKSDLEIILKEASVSKISNKTISEYMDIFLNEHQTKSGFPLNKLTRKKYTSFLNHLNDYCKANKIQPILESININFIKDFRKYLEDEVHHADNTVVKNLKAFKTFLSFLTRRGWIDHINLTEIKTTETEGEIYTMRVDEILKLQNKDFKDEIKNNVRDIFCFQCWTGQRISDIRSIKWEDIHVNDDGHKVWKLVTVKNPERVTVPIIKYAEEILKKHETSPQPLPILSENTINNELKEIAEIIGLNRNVRRLKYYKGNANVDYVPFHEVLSTHIARKSFITNSLILNVPERVVRNVSKHKSERSFRRYVEISEEYKDQKIREAYNF